MRSPVVAILWETWRVTRGEAAWKLALGIVGGLAGLVLLAAIGPMMGAGDLAFDGEVSASAVRDAGAVIALFLIFLVNIVGWWSIGNLNRVRPGFPFYLLYTRPVRTSVLVGVPIAYLTAVPVVSYLVSALLLTVISGHSFPLLPVAAWIAVVNLAHAAANWPIRRTVPRLLANMAVGVGWLLLVRHRLALAEVPHPEWTRPAEWSAVFDFPFTDYALFAALGVASLAVTVAGVARQRHDGESASSRWTPGISFPEPLVTLFRFPCPTSSAAWAQVWFDLRSRGLPVLMIGVVLALVILLVSAVSGPIDAAINADPRVSCPIAECFYARAFPPLFAPLSLFAVLVLGGNAFGIRRKRGRTYLSAFEVTHAHGTAQLAALKVLVKSVCVLAALVAIGVSAWVSVQLLGDSVFIQIWNLPLSSRLSAINGAVTALTGYEQLALAVVAAVGVVIWVAAFAVLGALWTRYSRRVNIAGSLLLFYGLALGLLALAGQRGIGPELPLGAILRATSWVAATGTVLATAWLLWRAFAERLLTLPQASGAMLVSAAFAAAWVTLLRAAGVPLAGMSAIGVVWILSPVLLPVIASVLAPWSLSRVRHT